MVPAEFRVLSFTIYGCSHREYLTAQQPVYVTLFFLVE